MTISTKPPVRRLLTRLAVAGSLVALPLGLTAAPVLAMPVTAVDHGWQGDCDHSGHFGWQQDRGRMQWNDCDMGRGHWDMHGNQWQWHHDRDYAPPAPMGSA
jgi:hypothetical protein